MRANSRCHIGIPGRALITVLVVDIPIYTVPVHQIRAIINCVLIYQTSTCRYETLEQDTLSQLELLVSTL
jgi:hypothetical protein